MPFAAVAQGIGLAWHGPTTRSSAANGHHVRTYAGVRL
jgi:hypothetical protein